MVALGFVAGFLATLFCFLVGAFLHRGEGDDLYFFEPFLWGLWIGCVITMTIFSPAIIRYWL